MAPVAMVCACTGVMNSLISKLSTLLEKECVEFRSVKKDLQLLKDELSGMYPTLEKYVICEKPDIQVNIWASNVRETCYDLEDYIDALMVPTEHKPTMSGVEYERFVRKIKNWRGHPVPVELQELMARVHQENKRGMRYKVDETLTTAQQNSMRIDPRIKALYVEANKPVGLDGPMDKIIKLLVDSDQRLKVVSIVGFGGLGKTTLAYQVYQKIKFKFDCTAFVSISQRPHMVKILKSMLSQLLGSRHNLSHDEPQLMDRLRQMLADKRYLIVFDDIWGERDWKILEYSLPRNHLGSRIITTTRINTVAKSCCDDIGGHIHEMHPLSDIDSRRLFLRRIFGSEDIHHPRFKMISEDPHLNKICEEILKKCGGLPLAITTLSSLLANKSIEYQNWEAVHRSLHSRLDVMDHMDQILSLSFNDLPSHLKTCLLYLSVFPEDYVIEREQLVWRWMAEGFIRETHGLTSEQVGNECFNELINRSMIQPVDIWYDGTAQNCRVHDLVLEFLISKSIEYNFVTILDGQERESTHHKIRRLSNQSNYVDKAARQMNREDLPHVRSFIPFGYVREEHNLGDFQALRVLDLGSCTSVENHHIENIGSLFQLKYLDLSRTNIGELPIHIGNLRYLETLDLRWCGIKKLPGTIAGLQRLQRLLVNKVVTLPDEIGNMQALELLLSASMSCNSIKFVEDIGRLIQMRTIEITFGRPAGMVDEVRTYTDYLVSSLNKLGKLESLKIDAEKGSLLDSLMEVCLTVRHLQKLFIDYISRLPKWIPSLVNLVHLEVAVVTVHKEDLHTLEGMVSLLYLQLETKNVPNEKLIVGSQGFQHLKEFHFKCWNDGMGLVFAAGAMPELQALCLCFRTRKTMSKYGGVDDCGIKHLLDLKNLCCEVDCSGSNNNEVEAVEASIRKAANKHHTQLTLEIQRWSEAYMIEDEVHEDNKYIPKKWMRRKQMGEEVHGEDCHESDGSAAKAEEIHEHKKNVPKNCMRIRRITRVTNVRVAFRVRAARSKWNRTLKNRLTSPSTTT